MNMPGFNAESSLYKSRFSYRATGVYMQTNPDTVSPSRWDPSETAGRLPRVPERRCICETPYCNCLYECGTPYVMCLLAEAIAFPSVSPSVVCDAVKEACFYDCKNQYDEDIRYTCYPIENPLSTLPSLQECKRQCKNLTGEQYAQCMGHCGVM